MKTKEIQLIVFDLDGTLIDAYDAVARSINHTMEALGLSVKSSALIKRSVGWGDRHLIRKFVGDQRLDEALAIYRAHHKRALAQGVRFLPGGADILRVLRRKKYRLAVATNRPSFFTHLILRRLKMQKFFDAVICADEVDQGKPHPRMLLSLLENFSMKPSQAVYVGDMVIDVQTARRARVKSVAVTTGSSRKKELRLLQPHRIIARIDLLERVLDEWETTAPKTGKKILMKKKAKRKN